MFFYFFMPLSAKTPSFEVCVRFRRIHFRFVYMFCVIFLGKLSQGLPELRQSLPELTQTYTASQWRRSYGVMFFRTSDGFFLREFV